MIRQRYWLMMWWFLKQMRFCCIDFCSIWTCKYLTPDDDDLFHSAVRIRSLHNTNTIPSNSLYIFVLMYKCKCMLRPYFRIYTYSMTHRLGEQISQSVLEQGQPKHTDLPDPRMCSGFRGICSCKYNSFPVTNPCHMDRPQPQR